MNRPLALVLAAGAVHACSTARIAEAEPMTAADPHAIVVNADGATLHVRFEYTAAGNRLSLRYRLINTGGTPLAVFDRGAAVGTRITAGFPVPPVEAGGITLNHLPEPATPFERGRTGPYAPKVALAARVEPGGEHAGLEQVNPPDAAERVRYCLGIAPFDAARYQVYAHKPKDDTGMPLWRAPYRDDIDDLTVLCTPWFDLQASAFE